VLDTAVIAALVGVFLLVAGYSSLMLRRLVRATAHPRERRRGDADAPARRQPPQDG
jgi:hypothetical protein